MKLFNNIIVIIPALEKNKYSLKGDLCPWGETTLLEWKVSQARKIKFIKDIIVSSPSLKIKKKCEEIGVNFLKRKSNKNLTKFYSEISKKFPTCYLMFLNPTSPFISSSLINKIVLYYNNKKNNYDSILSTKNLKEYLFMNGTSISFDAKKTLKSRSLINVIKQLTNGISIITSKSCFEKKSFIGYKPLFYEIDWLSSLEIKTIDDYKMYDQLINYYLEKN